MTTRPPRLSSEQRRIRSESRVKAEWVNSHKREFEIETISLRPAEFVKYEEVEDDWQEIK